MSAGPRTPAGSHAWTASERLLTVRGDFRIIFAS